MLSPYPLRIPGLIAGIFAVLLVVDSSAQDDDFRFEFNKQPEDKINYQQRRISQSDFFTKLRRSEERYNYNVGEIGLGPSSVSPLLPGTTAPVFSVTGLTGNVVRVDPEQLEKPLVITFYRGGWCPYCNLHLAELRKAEKDLLAMGFDVWFISPDKPERLYESLDDPDIGYTLYSDSSIDAARAFGIAYQVKQSDLDKFFNGGVSLQRASGKEHTYLPAPGTFIIGTDGLVHFQYVNPNYKTRLDPEILIAAASSYSKYAQQALATN